MTTYNIVLKSENDLYRVARIEHNFHDGSLYISLVRDAMEIKGFSGKVRVESREVVNQSAIIERNNKVKITYHTSGTINYHNLSRNRIYAEPLFNISKPFHFFSYLINKTDRLIKVDDVDSKIEFIAPKKEIDQFYSFGLSISEKKDDNSFSIMFCGGLFYLNIIFSISDPIKSEQSPAFFYLTPEGLKDKPELSNSSCILYHQKINNTDGVIIYEPDASGLYTMIYHENRRSIPIGESLIRFKNPNLKLKFTTAKSNYARFYVINSRSGSKVHDISNQIEAIIFDNEIY